MAEASQCLFCDQTATYRGLGPLDQVYRVECPNCGTYHITDIINDRDRDTVKEYTPHRHNISGLIREKNDLGLQMEIIKTDNIRNLFNDPLIPKTISQKLDKVLSYFYRKTKVFGENFELTEDVPYSIGYAHNYAEFEKMVETLDDQGFLIINEIRIDDIVSFYVSFEGMSRAEELMATNIASSKVFVAMGFKQDLLEAHRRAIQPACHECGFDASLILDTEHNDDITDKIIAEIKTSKFVITDFTYNNQGAYFEAGYAQGRGLPVIRTCKKEWFDAKDENGEKNRLHFDINHYNFILWENYDDLKEKLINRIRATIV